MDEDMETWMKEKDMENKGKDIETWTRTWKNGREHRNMDRDKEPSRHRNMETRNMERWRHGTWRDGDTETWRHRNKKT